MAKKYRGSSVKRKNLIEISGVSVLLKAIEDAGGKVDEILKVVVDKSLEIVGNDMQSFMSQHKETGKTMSSYDQKRAKSSKRNVIKAEVGYAVRKGGLPAIFLDVGTPKQKPYFYRYYAVENNRQKIKEIQMEALQEVLRGLQG